jgi:hypothetical protein
MSAVQSVRDGASTLYPEVVPGRALTTFMAGIQSPVWDDHHHLRLRLCERVVLNTTRLNVQLARDYEQAAMGVSANAFLTQVPTLF